MNSRTFNFRKEDGLTLVELLAALALAGLLLILISTILSTSLLAYGRVNHETELRNKAITLSAALQAKLKNTVSVSSPDLSSINAEVITDVMSDSSSPVSLTLKDGGLYDKNGKLFSDSELDLTGSYFIKANKELQIHLWCRLAGESKMEPLYLFVSIKLIS